MKQFAEFKDWASECTERGWQGPFKLVGRPENSYQFVADGKGSMSLWNGERGIGYIYSDESLSDAGWCVHSTHRGKHTKTPECIDWMSSAVPEGNSVLEMHKLCCAMKLGKPSEEGTCCVLVECNCGQRAREYEAIRRILDNQLKRMAMIDGDVVAMLGAYEDLKGFET